MRTQPKHKLGESVSVEFIGEIVSVTYNFKNQIEYKVDKGNGVYAYVKENCLHTLPAPEDFLKEEKPIKCLICSKTFKSAIEFHEHLFLNGFLRPDHVIPENWDYQTHRCVFCGGKVMSKGIPPDGWETTCLNCDFLYDED